MATCSTYQFAGLRVDDNILRIAVGLRLGTTPYVLPMPVIIGRPHGQGWLELQIQ